MTPCPKCGTTEEHGFYGQGRSGENGLEVAVRCSTCNFVGPFRENSSEAIDAWDNQTIDRKQLIDAVE